MALAEQDTKDSEQELAEASAHLMGRTDIHEVCQQKLADQNKVVETLINMRRAKFSGRLEQIRDRTARMECGEALRRLHTEEEAELKWEREVNEMDMVKGKLRDAVDRRGILAKENIADSGAGLLRKRDEVAALKTKVDELIETCNEYMADKELRKVINDAMRKRVQLGQVQATALHAESEVHVHVHLG